MKVWILDDSHFPTGYANGGMKKVGKELQKCSVYHLCVDLVGPARTYVDVNALLGEFSSDFRKPSSRKGKRTSYSCFVSTKKMRYPMI